MKRVFSSFVAFLARRAGYVFDGKLGLWVAGAATGVGATGIGASTLLSMMGFSAVAHSSGAIILTGAGGYIAGTYGIAAIVGYLLWFPMLLLLTVLALLGAVILVGRKLRTTIKP